MADRIPKSAQPKRRKRDAPTYIPMGLEKEMMVRLDTRLRSELEHAHRKAVKRKSGISLSVFISYCCAKGLDDVINPKSKLGQDVTIDTDLPARLDSRLRSQLEQEFRRIYKEIPAPSLGLFVAFCCAKGLSVALDTHARSSRGEQVIDE